MDGNKDEADRCIQIALRCIQAGDREKARKFLNKAERLYPSDRVKELLARVNHTSNGSAAGPEETDGGGTEDPSGAEGGPRLRKSTASTASAAGAASAESSPTEEAKYTPEQQVLVRKIIKCKNYYEILGVAKDCVEDDLKKAYRKLALKLHPDKNHAPGATEAFKAVGKAFGVLNDGEKRRRYDVYGSEADRATSSSRRHGHSHNGHYEFDDDISAEEIFNMFFGGAFPSSNVRTRRMYTQREQHFHHNNHQNQADSSSFLLQLSPILFMIFLSLLSSFLVADPTYSMSRDHKYSMERYTQNLRVPYYVKSDFGTEYKGSMRRLEQQVEEEYISTLRSNCFKERSYKENMLWRARNFGDGKLYEKAQSLKTPSCDRLQSIYA